MVVNVPFISLILKIVGSAVSGRSRGEGFSGAIIPDDEVNLHISHGDLLSISEVVSSFFAKRDLTLEGRLG